MKRNIHENCTLRNIILFVIWKYSDVLLIWPEIKMIIFIIVEKYMLRNIEIHIFIHRIIVHFLFFQTTNLRAKQNIYDGWLIYYALLIFYDVAYQQGQVSYQENNKIALFPFYYLLIGNYTCIMNFSRTIPTNYVLRVRFVWHKKIHSE